MALLGFVKLAMAASMSISARSFPFKAMFFARQLAYFGHSQALGGGIANWDSVEDRGEQSPWHGHFSQLERNVLGVPGHFGMKRVIFPGFQWVGVKPGRAILLDPSPCLKYHVT